MAKITRIDSLEGGEMLDIQLDNGNIILLQISHLLDTPKFSALWEDDRIIHPRTDGECVYWRDGPSLTFKEIIDFLQR